MVSKEINGWYATG